MVSRSHPKTGGRKVAIVAKIALAAILLVAHTQSFAQARPFGDVQDRELNATNLSQGTTQELLQELVSSLQSHQDQPRSDGYVGIHPLPRKRSVAPQKRQGALPQIVPNVAAAASTAAPPPASKADAAPTIQPASKAAPSSSGKPSPSPSNDPDSDSDSGSDEGASGVAALFNPHNKLFPLAIALTIAMVLGVLLVLVSIGKCVSHRQLARDQRDGKSKYSTKNNDFMVASAGNSDLGRKRTLGKSLRRALTRSRLGGGSFARREREGTVLIDVGDEVYAVTPEVAKEYERERKSCLSGYSGSSGGSSGGSRLTFPANQPTPLRQALYNAQLIVAANEAEKAGGKPQAPRGFDINSWRRDSVGTSSEGSYSEYDEKTLHGSSHYSKGNSALPPVDPLQRSLSQRLADGLRALTHGDQNTGASREKRAFSFDSEMQMPGALRQAPLSSTVPVLTRGGGGWAVQRQQGNDQDDFKPMRKPVRQQNSDTTLRDSALSHERHNLRDDGPTAASGKRQNVNGGGGVPLNNTANGARPKSILVKNAQQKAAMAARRSAGGPNAVAATSKGDLQRRATKVASSTSHGSPKMYQNRTFAADTATATKGTATGAGGTRKPLILKPEMPARGMNANGGQAGEKKSSDGNAAPANTRELYRPLPMPPSFGPIDLGNPKK
ncbi:uncharacterized protein FA14DRAFT_192044 [Meira miltonrushii]|uniref:Uncharacterized protein n=1 Tax=Meira miltonrushii TaxID=1280837 RepID=A0A316V957_9BASI|nr:uncharacterized protein FA14DRAFT_192044 [Meira miltonrushii]PWN33001.1 hypothetical protein FA14DRAFT_192044 [Meira miltonrushii]